MNAPGYFVPTEGNFARPEVVSAIAAGIPRGETIRAALGWSRFEFGYRKIGQAYIIITDKAIYAAKDKVFGKAKPDVRVALESINEIGRGPLYGVGPTWSVQFMAPGLGFFYVSNGEDAEQVFDILGRSLRGLTDPDMDHFNRGIDAGRAAPAGDAGKAMSATEVSQEASRIRSLVAAGSLQEAWDRRVELGYGVPSEGVPQADRFWIDADPAIAALKLGYKDHPMVAMCCGVAESNADVRDPAQAEAVELFNRLYHGAPPPSEVAPLPTSAVDPLNTVNRVHNTMRMAEEGDAASSLYMEGLALEARGETEAALFKSVEAAQLGSVDAMREAGALAGQLGRDRDSLFWYESAAQAGDPVGMYNMGAAAVEAHDRVSAARWFQQAAEGGIADGYAALTQLADEAGDSEAELRWSGLGAAAGQVFCIARHGLLLAMGAEGDTAKTRRARDYLEQAADRGDVPSAALAVDLNARLSEPSRGRRFVDVVLASGDQEQIERLRRYGYL